MTYDLVCTVATMGETDGPNIWHGHPEKVCAQLRGEELGAIALVALGTGREADTRDSVFG